MALTPLQQLVRIKPRPETTLALETAIKAGASTVATYRFTPSIQDHFRAVFDLAVSERGQGYWVQAEYGAGKTHFLATLGILLTDRRGQAWDAVGPEELRGYRGALVGRPGLFPVVLNCKGRLATEGGSHSLQRLLEQAIREALERAGLGGQVALSTADEVLAWWQQAPPGVRADLTAQVRSRFSGGPTPEELRERKGDEACAKALLEAARALHLELPFSRDVRTRLGHIYRQLTRQHGYRGLLVIIDEFKSWQDLHPAGSPGHAEDEHVLETLAFHLPVDEHAQILTIVASQSPPPAKLMGGGTGDRFHYFTLFASEQSAREYDEIVAFRVRELLPATEAAVHDYYAHYFKHFKFLAHTSAAYFREVFPFQPRCFDVIRKLTQELASARSSIHFAHEVLQAPGVLGRTALIRLTDMLRSDNLVHELHTAAFRDAYRSYQDACGALPSLFDEDADRELAQDVLNTLFLWHCAHPREPKGLTAAELAEACLTEDEPQGARREDLLHGIILARLKELAQVEYTNKATGAFFRVSATTGPTYSQLLARQQSKVRDEDAAARWLALLLEPSQHLGGTVMLLEGRVLGRVEKATARANKIRYDGERVVVEHWSRNWGKPVTDPHDYALHFRLIYLREPAEVPPTDLGEEDRVAVIIPRAWHEVAREELRRYCAILALEQEYADRQGPDAEEVKQLNRSKKKEVLEELRLRQADAFRSGRIVTRAGLGISPAQAFAEPAKADEFIGAALLEHAYSKPPFDPTLFRRELTGTEPGRIFAALLQGSGTSADQSAVENFARGLGLTSPRKPKELDPVACPLFDLLTHELEAAGGELKLYALYERWAGPPYGVPAEVLSLLLAAFVRYSQPPCYLTVRPEAAVTLKSGARPRDNRLGFADIPQLAWKPNKLHRAFAQLVLMQGPSWNDYVEYFRALDDTLQATTEQEQVVTQQERLKKAFHDWAERIKALRGRLVRLAQLLQQQSALRPALAQLDAVQAACESDPHHLLSFASVFEERFDKNGETFFEAVARVKQMDELDRHALQPLFDAVAYLDGMEGLPAGEVLAAERARVRQLFDLPAFCGSPAAALDALRQFEQLRQSYREQYRRHYQAYRTTLGQLHGQLGQQDALVQGLVAMDGVPDLGQPQAVRLVRAYRDLLKNTDPASLPEHPPEQPDRPLVAGIRLDTQPPEPEVQEWEGQLGTLLIARLAVLAAPQVHDVLARDQDPGVRGLVAAVEAGDERAMGRACTAAVATRVRELLHHAKLVVVDVGLADFGPVQVSEAGPELKEAVRQFETFLRNRLAQARSAHPGKIVRINLT